MSNEIDTTICNKKAKTDVIIGYALAILGLVTIFGWIGAVIWAYCKRSEVKGTIYADHLENIITTFWYGLMWIVLGALLIMIFVGFLIIPIASIWILYRTISGLAKVTSDKPYKNTHQNEGL
ncbi:DUF4870 family protein [Vibrio breoganii]